LKPLLAGAESSHQRKPATMRKKTSPLAAESDALAGHDVGQSVAICDRALRGCGGYEGTDAMLRRAATLVKATRSACEGFEAAGHLLFDVPWPL